ncbi:MAG: helix-turn-helix transcriptional regulator [Oscillospiraceae bacterium]
MTTGERITALRKEKGLSQEAFGEALGVSRQAISKWEAGSSLPDVEKLVAMGKLYGVTVGWILGIEEERGAAGELSPEQLQMAEEIARRYIEARPPSAPVGHKKAKVAVAVLLALGLIIFGANLLGSLKSVSEKQKNLENQLSNITVRMSQQEYGIASRVEEILKAQNSMLADYSVENTSKDLKAGTTAFTVTLTPRTYTAGLTVELIADCGEGVVSVYPQEGEGHEFSGEISCRLTNSITVSAVLHDGDTAQTQLLQVYGDLLYGTYIMGDFDSFGTYFWCDKPEELLEKHPNGYDFSVGISSRLPWDNVTEVTIDAVEFQIWLNGKECASAEGALIDGKASDESVYPGEVFGEYGFTAKLPLTCLDGLLTGDSLEIAAIGTDSFERRYVISYGAYTLGEDGRLEFSDSAPRTPELALDNPKPLAPSPQQG